MTPENRERIDIIADIILGNPKLCHMIQHSVMKARFERINGLEKGDPNHG